MNKPKNTMKVSFPSRGANEGLARMLVAAFITEADPTVEELCDIKTAVYHRRQRTGRAGLCGDAGADG